MRKNRTIKTRMVGALLGLVILQICVFAISIMARGTFETLNHEAIRNFTNKVENRSRYISELMVGRWSNISSFSSEITANFDKYIASNDNSDSGAEKNTAINERLSEIAFPTIMTMLRKTGTTGAYIVLNNNEISDNPNSYGGVYIRDFDPDSGSQLNYDVLLAVGTPSLSEKTGISLDSCWQPFYTFSENSKTNSNFFYTPLERAEKLKKTATNEKFEYWCKDFKLDGNDYIDSISYSSPLINKDGVIYGVLGVEISKNYLKKQLNSMDLSQSQSGVYAIATSDENKNILNLVSDSGGHAFKYWGNESCIKIKDSKEEILKEIEDDKSEKIFLYKEKLRLYNTNSAFSNEEWFVAGINSENDIFFFAYEFGIGLLISGIFVLLTGISLSFILGRNITEPITKLVAQLRASNPNKKIKLNKIGVTEIDELSNSIEDLSDRVFDTQKRISQIIAMTEVPVGYFEYFRESNEVFCTESLADILGWKFFNHKDNYIALDEFKTKMSALDSYKLSEDPLVFNMENKKWLKLITFIDGSRVFGTLSDITKEVLEKKRSEYERDYDVMTGTLNRTAFSQKALQLFRGGRDILKVSAVFMADLDNLKYTNDNFGHDIGDLYIKTFANLLKNFNFKNGLVSRRSGDEFYVLFHGFNSREEIMDIIMDFWKFLDNANVSVSPTVEIKVRASAGIAWYPDDSTDFQELLSYADFAMYTVKNSVKGTYRIFNMENYSENAVVYKGQEELNKLIENNLVRYAFQPIVMAEDASVYGYEMLMRPVLPFFSSVSEVIRTAKYQNKMGEIEKLTWYASLLAATQKFSEENIGENVKVFINSISDQILKADDISYITEKYGDFLHRVVLEFTEDTRADIEYSNQKRDIVKKWKGMLAIDDFGSGYNNENNLIDNLPNIIKLDMILVRNIDNDENRRSLVQNIIHFAKDRKILILGEGVETQGEMETLVNMGVDLMQGYYFGRPQFTPCKIEAEKVAKVKQLNEKLRAKNYLR